MNVHMATIYIVGWLDTAKIINDVVVGVSVAIILGLWTACHIGLRIIKGSLGAIIHCLDSSRRLEHDMGYIKSFCQIRIPPYPDNFTIPPQISDYVQRDKG